jgi:glucose uptake protein GlcU
MTSTPPTGIAKANPLHQHCVAMSWLFGIVVVGERVKHHQHRAWRR